jgi:hypothetical protein
MEQGFRRTKMKRSLNWDLIAMLVATVIFWMFVVIFTMSLVGCNWCGQKHQRFTDDKLTQNDEFWSMRFLWMSNGIEAYNETLYWKTGFKAETTKTDPNAVKAATEGAVEGLKTF